MLILEAPGTLDFLAPSINYSSCRDVVQLYSVRHSGDMARIRDTAPAICRGFVIFEVRHAKRPGDLWISSTAVRYSSRSSEFVTLNWCSSLRRLVSKAYPASESSPYRRCRGTKAPTGEDRRALLATRGLESGQSPAV